MKKFMHIIVLLLCVALLVTGCKAPEPEPETDELEAATPAPTAAPTTKGWEPDPTITPFVFEGELVTPEPGHFAPLIHPMDRPKLVFEPYKYDEFPTVGVGFEFPENWVRTNDSAAANTITFYEPYDDIQSNEPTPASIDVAISTLGSAPSKAQVEQAITDELNSLKGQFSGLEYSSFADQKMKEFPDMGRYVTYWIEVPIDGQVETVRMRGRIHVVPVDKKLVMIRYACPADYNSDYEEVYMRVRDTIKLL